MLHHLIATNLIIPYLVLFFLFRKAFIKINGKYIQDVNITPYPIDMRAYKTKKYADTQYLITAKNTGYNHSLYFKYFLPLDLIYPIAYTLLFLSCLMYCQMPFLKTFFSILIVSGAILDWSEDISFSLFLNSASNGLAPLVAFFTTIKTVVFTVNLFACLFWILVGVKMMLFKS